MRIKIEQKVNKVLTLERLYAITILIKDNVTAARRCKKSA